MIPYHLFILAGAIVVNGIILPIAAGKVGVWYPAGEVYVLLVIAVTELSGGCPDVTLLRCVTLMFMLFDCCRSAREECPGAVCLCGVPCALSLSQMLKFGCIWSTLSTGQVHVPYILCP